LDIVVLEVDYSNDSTISNFKIWKYVVT